MDQQWFEMQSIRKGYLKTAVWIPLRRSGWIERIGRTGFLGFKDDYVSTVSLAVPLKQKTAAEKLGWDDLGNWPGHGPQAYEGTYVESDIYQAQDGTFQGVHLVLEQSFDGAELTEWHLHQDLVLALGLKREADVWVDPSEGYLAVAKLMRKDDGSPFSLEMRAAHLRDYLRARSMALCVTSFRSRAEVVEDSGHIDWPNNPYLVSVQDFRWEGRVVDIHEGGAPLGSSTAVFHVGRTDVDPDDEVPALAFPSDEDIISSTWTYEEEGRPLKSIRADLWKTEWVEPGTASPRVLDEKAAPTVFFITDAEGTRESRQTLAGKGSRWLWFRPEVVKSLTNLRGGGLEWYTRDTGRVSCSPGRGVHFGINQLGLINVYAKDIALLPDWQQSIWAGHNVGPDGLVSEELLASQVRADPASTLAPERLLGDVLDRLGEASMARYGVRLIQDSGLKEELLARCHRFRALDLPGLFELAKDLTRVTAESLDRTAMHKLLNLPKGDPLGSLKSLTRLLAQDVEDETARTIVGPLVGIYELRLADAHLPSGSLDRSFSLVGIDRQKPLVHQGLQLLEAAVLSLNRVAKIMDA